MKENYMQILPIIGQLQHNTNFNGKLIVNTPYDDNNGKKKYSTDTIELDWHLSRHLREHITDNIINIYGNKYMHNWAYEKMMNILERNPDVNKQKSNKNIHLPHAYWHDGISDTLGSMSYLTYPEHSSGMVQFNTWRDDDGMHLRVGKRLEIIV